MTFFVDWNCSMHQGNLVVKSSLRLLDLRMSEAKFGFKYFSTLAKLTNVWRENARSLLEIWVAIHGDLSAADKAIKMAPRCIAGRWGSVSKTEAFLMNAGEHETAAAFKMLMGKKGPRTLLTSAIADEPETASSNAVIPDIAMEPVHNQPQALAAPSCRALVQDSAIDDCRLEEQAEYRNKMGRWFREAYVALVDPKFWLVVSVASRTRQPMDHLLHAIQQKTDTANLESRGGHVAYLQHTLGGRLISQYDSILCDSIF